MRNKSLHCHEVPGPMVNGKCRWYKCYFLISADFPVGLSEKSLYEYEVVVRCNRKYGEIGRYLLSDRQDELLWMTDDRFLQKMMDFLQLGFWFPQRIPPISFRRVCIPFTLLFKSSQFSKVIYHVLYAWCIEIIQFTHYTVPVHTLKTWFKSTSSSQSRISYILRDHRSIELYYMDNRLDAFVSDVFIIFSA